MRIIGGDLAGRTVAVPPGEIRPIMDRMRESLFAILGDLHGTSFLDLFSGSAVVALEAYSRGARPVVAVEKDRGKRRVTGDNVAGLVPPVRLIFEPVERFVARGRTAFSTIYVDPPFAYAHRIDLLRRIGSSALVEAGTTVVIHVPRTDPVPDRVGALRVTDRRSFGGSLLAFLWIE